MKEFEVEALITENVIVVLPSGMDTKAVPLDLALNNSEKPFVTYGLPKKLKSYIEKHAKATLPKIKTKYPKFTALVQAPSVGRIIDVAESAEEPNYWFKMGTYPMTLEEAREYSKYFDTVFFTMEDSIKKLLRSLNITNLG